MARKRSLRSRIRGIRNQLLQLKHADWRSKHHDSSKRWKEEEERRAGRAEARVL